MKNRTIAESLNPTFENVTREFITDTLYKILFSDEFPNFKFNFIEDEAIEFIEKTLQDYRDEFKNESFVKELKEKHKKILEVIRQNTDNNDINPIMKISNYKEFFELLRQYYEKDIELFFRRTDMSGFPVYEQKNCFEQIWLRMTPEDFNNPEEFLRRNVEMIQDNTFEKYDNETYLGKLSRFNNHIMCVKNQISRTWDETPREFKISIYDKRYYDTELSYKPNFELPVVRYGIYKRDGKKVCYIGAIQNTNTEESESNLVQIKNDCRSELNTKKLKKQNYKEKVEPIKILSLSIFINFLHREGITEIEAPGMYVLDYDYHIKRGIKLKKEFDEKWTEEEKEENPKQYEKEMQYLSHNYGNEDTISEIKTERFIMNVKSLLSYYPNGMINSFPGELDSFLHLEIPISMPQMESNNILTDMYNLIKEKYEAKER